MCGAVAHWLERRTRDRGSYVRILLEPLRSPDNSVFPTLPVSSGGHTKSRPASVLPGGRKISHTGGNCVSCRGLHNCETKHSCVSPNMGYLDYIYVPKTDNCIQFHEIQPQVLLNSMHIAAYYFTSTWRRRRP